MSTWRTLLHTSLIGLLILIGYSLYSYGKESVQAKWDQEKREKSKQIQELQIRISEMEQEHQRESRRISDELATERKRHEERLALSDAEHNRRLLLAEERASIYQRQAQSGATECRDLADHASRLDTTLEEGRSLVRELRETLGFREQQIRSLSHQLMTDRMLFSDEVLTDGR